MKGAKRTNAFFALVGVSLKNTLWVLFEGQNGNGRQSTAVDLVFFAFCR